MKPADLIKETLFPLTDLSMLMAIIGFGFLLWVASAAGILGLWLMFIVVPALFRYGLYLLEARAHGKATLVAGIEVFDIVDNFWGIFPLLLFGAFAWFEFYLVTTVSLQAAQVVCGLSFLVYPASMAVLAVTRSPLDSVNPLMVFRMIRVCGIDYVWIPLVLTFVMIAAGFLVSFGPPTIVLFFAGTYVFFLMFTFTGAVLHANEVAGEIEIEAPVEKSDIEISSELDAERQNVANHAYGFISRGNREGGFQHIRRWIESDPDTDDAVSWFFNEMMRWERKEAALFFAQDCLAHYLHHELDAKALKLIATCVHEDPQWKPKLEDRQHAIKLAEAHGREDLVRSLSR